MKYQRKRTRVSKNIYDIPNKESTKNPRFKKQVRASVILIAIMFILSGTGVIKRPFVKSVFGYCKKITDIQSVQSLKNSKFLKNVGEHIYDFCFGYLKKEDFKKSSAYAAAKETADNTIKLSENTTETAKPETFSDAEPPITPKETVIFEPTWPCKGEISSEFGSRLHPVSGEEKFHNGIDIAVAEGTQITACEDGTIKVATYNDYSGNYVIITHDGGFTSSYSHLSHILTLEGMNVKKGEVIGLAGSTGIATGPHLHFEIKEDGTCKNPKDFINK